ncbi:MAG: methyltransferase domain-containing protein, partial [Phycisphaeraceae bacterium]|nr:methyltransferase domain-containing protein [Phycisphaeraceae bacterium]
MIELNDASSDWFEHAFGAMYARRYGHRDDTEAQRQVRQLVDWLEPPTGCRVLDVCCGGGRHLEPLLAMGFSAWGVDLSSDLLALAARRPALRGRLVRADARALPFVVCFDWLVNLFTSFGYFRDEADNRRQLAGMAEALRPGGRLVLDLPNRT